MNSTVSVFLKTESSDEYHFMFTRVSNIEDFVCRVHNELGCELGYVWEVSVVVDGGLDKPTLEQAVYEKIREMEGE